MANFAWPAAGSFFLKLSLRPLLGRLQLIRERLHLLLRDIGFDHLTVSAMIWLNLNSWFNLTTPSPKRSQRFIHRVSTCLTMVGPIYAPPPAPPPAPRPRSRAAWRASAATWRRTGATRCGGAASRGARSGSRRWAPRGRGSPGPPPCRPTCSSAEGFSCAKATHASSIVCRKLRKGP